MYKDELEKEERMGKYAGRKNVNKGLFDSSSGSDFEELPKNLREWTLDIDGIPVELQPKSWSSIPS